MKSVESAQLATIEESLSASAGSVLHYRSTPLTIDRVLTLGPIDLGSKSFELWDPIQLGRHTLKVDVPSGPMTVSVAVSQDWACCLAIRFAATPIARWYEVGETWGPFGTIVLSRVGLRAEISEIKFWSSFYDEVFDEAFDPAVGAAIARFPLSNRQESVLAWSDKQMGGTLFRGEDKTGQVTQLLFTTFGQS